MRAVKSRGVRSTERRLRAVMIAKESRLAYAGERTARQA
jgi:hypothetical protein